MIDPRIVGTWVLNINPGRWVWEIGAHGTYEFRSEASDFAPTHAGLITTVGVLPEERRPSRACAESAAAHVTQGFAHTDGSRTDP
jgi:hypothetical protein